MAQAALKNPLDALPARPVMDFPRLSDNVDRSLAVKRNIKEFDDGARRWAADLQRLVVDQQQALEHIQADRALLKYFYNSLFKTIEAMRRADAKSTLHWQASYDEMQRLADLAPPDKRGTVRRMLRQFRDIVERMDKISAHFADSLGKVAEKAYVQCHRDQDVTLSREQYPRKARLVHSLEQDGWHRFSSPDVIGLNAGGPTLEEARRDALSTLRFIAQHRGATVPEAVFVERESSEA